MLQMRYLISLSALGLFLFGACRSTYPETPDRLQTSYPRLNKQLQGLVNVDSFTISPAEATQLPEAVYLDARERVEYDVSHLPDARYIGFGTLDTTTLRSLSSATPLVVYCTVGYRSERIARELRMLGFTDVYNLYGSLYAWRLAGLPLVDAQGMPTDLIHTYNRKWGTFIPDTLGTKVY
ncbi:Thiosulfate sulfurtransferase GlpE [Neolewinella maritima]|uniref:Thiosulfate sulfurtransferase GlpE n=1 Tax=Neolewinella maritima TaxID=1383882 RepID=A0ABN8F958_9BACT|nr:rhodanese-like domain-containing protein [Neolewinella maritima]CAH1000992.1 Thiosulfate sulfurtransferase GlpE [Neolewinella maritima]